ncbi:MAG: recombinase family protein [Thermoleophilia bacterium]|nr:recombinase family protein [Thermoleophilia bacterium]
MGELGESDRTLCVIYAAKSTEDKRGSIQTQLEDCREMAAREGWEVIGEYSDEGFSAYSGNRGENLVGAKAHAAAAASERGETVMLLSQHSDRLARGAGDRPGAPDSLDEIWRSMRRADVHLRSAQNDFELSDPVLVAVAGKRDYEDSRRKSEAVKSGKQRQRAKGERPGSPVPDGYRKVSEHGKEIESDPGREATIRRMFDLVLGGMAPAAAGRRLNEEGYTSTRGGAWNRRTVEDKVSNPFYAGAVVWYRGKPEEEIIWEPQLKHPAYITREQHEEIVASIRRRDKALGSDRRPRKKGRPNEHHVLAGIAWCARCKAAGRKNGRMRPRRMGTYITVAGERRAYRGYRCSNREDYGTCDAPSIRVADLDPPLLEALPRLIVDFDGWIRGLTERRDGARSRLAGQLQQEVEALATVDRKLSTFHDRYSDAIDAGDEIRAEREAGVLDRERSKRVGVEKRIAELEASLAKCGESTPHDKVLDWWIDLRADLAAAKASTTLSDARSRLADRFSRVLLDTRDDKIIVAFELHEEAAEQVIEGTGGSAYAMPDEAMADLIDVAYGRPTGKPAKALEKRGLQPDGTPHLDAWLAKKPLPMPTHIPITNAPNAQE